MPLQDPIMEFDKGYCPLFCRLISPKRLFLSFLKIDSDKYELLTIEQKNKLKESYPVAYLNSEIFYSMIEKYDEKESPFLKIGGHFLRTDIKNLDEVWAMELTAARNSVEQRKYSRLFGQTRFTNRIFGFRI